MKPAEFSLILASIWLAPQANPPIRLALAAAYTLTALVEVGWMVLK